MKNRNILISIFFMFLFVCCNDFEEVNTNPDTTTKVTSAMLATNLLRDITTDNNGDGKGFIREDLLGKYLSWTEAQDIDIAFNLLGRTSFASLSNLRNASKMVEYAQSEKLKNSYAAFAHFVRVFVFFDMTMRVGDIPYSEALKGENEKIYFPKYDTQKDVFIGLLEELDEADYLLGCPVRCTNFSSLS